MPRKLRDEQKGIIFIALIFVVLAMVSLFFFLYLKTNSVKDKLENDALIRMLFVVEDDQSNALFSDVLIYDTTSKKAGIISLPGYTGNIYQSLGRTDRLDSVYNELGITQFRVEVEKLLGIVIPYTAIIKLQDFIKLCDMLGGMRVFIPSSIDTVSESGIRWLLPSGAVNLDGDKIATYLQYRDTEETEEDIQDRYQNVMLAFLTGLHDSKFIIFNKKNFKKYAACLQTNVDDDEEETLYSLIAEVDTESIIKQSVTGSIRKVDDQQLMFPLNNGENVRNAVKALTGMLNSTDGTLSSFVYVIQILNGTTTMGLARNTSILFQNASYNVLNADNADRNDYEETVIIDHVGNEDAAKKVGDFIHCTNIIQANPEEDTGDSSKANIDFTIILGKDFNGQYVVQRKASK